MATIDDIKARLADANARIESATKDGDEDAEFRAYADEEAATAELLTAEKTARRLAGKRLEREAKRTAAGAYQVGAFDLASLLPQLDAAKMPGGGLIVVRSPTTDARKRHEAAHTTDGAAQDDLMDANVSLVCDCTIHPTFKIGDAGAVAFRRWWETDGRGVVALVTLQIQKLGGFALDAFRKATG